MKKIVVVMFCLLLFKGVAMSDFVEHPQYAKINTFTASVVAQIATLQDQFFIEHSRYFQGVWLLGDVEVDGTTDEDAINTSKPTDFDFNWRDFGPAVFVNNLKVPVNVKIDVYESPLGWGWMLVAEIYYANLGPDNYGNDGDHWMYFHHDGPEDIPGIFDEWIIQPDAP